MSAAPDLDGMFASITRQLDLAEVLPVDVRVCIVLSGSGGGAWTVETTGVPSVRRGDVQPADCRLSCTVVDFLALVEGRMAPRDGFLEGRLDVEGDVGLILRLQRALVRLYDETRAGMAP